MDKFNKIIKELEARSATGLFITWFTVLVIIILDWLTLSIPPLVSSGILIVGITAFVLQAVSSIVLWHQLPKELITLNRDEVSYLLESAQTRTRTQNHRLNNPVTISLEDKGFLIRRNVKRGVNMVPCTIRHIAWKVINNPKHQRKLKNRLAETVIPEFRIKES